MLLHIPAVFLLLLPLFVVAGLFALMVHITGSLASGALWRRQARPILEGSAHGLHPQARALWWFWCAQMGPWTAHQPRYSAHARLAAQARAQHSPDTRPGALAH